MKLLIVILMSAGLSTSAFAEKNNMQKFTEAFDTTLAVTTIAGAGCVVGAVIGTADNARFNPPAGCAIGATITLGTAVALGYAIQNANAAELPSQQELSNQSEDSQE